MITRANDGIERIVVYDGAAFIVRWPLIGHHSGVRGGSLLVGRRQLEADLWAAERAYARKPDVSSSTGGADAEGLGALNEDLRRRGFGGPAWGRR